MRVGFAGLGQMGGPMCRNLLASSAHDVIAYDLDATRLAGAVELGAERARSAADLGAGTDVVCIVVGDADQALSLLDGDDGILSGSGPGLVVVLHSTVGMDAVREIGARTAAAGAALVDAGISGGPAGANAGSLYVMCGGAPDAIERTRSVLETYAAHVVRFGELGAGMAAKLARNMAHYTLIAGIHESMLLAERSGVELTQFAHLVRASGLLGAVEAWLDRPTTDPFDASVDPAQLAGRRHYLALAHKDLGGAYGLGDEVGAITPVSRAAFDAMPSALNLPT